MNSPLGLRKISGPGTEGQNRTVLHCSAPPYPTLKTVPEWVSSGGQSKTVALEALLSIPRTHLPRLPTLTGCHSVLYLLSQLIDGSLNVCIIHTFHIPDDWNHETLKRAEAVFTFKLKGLLPTPPFDSFDARNQGLTHVRQGFDH